MESSLSALSHTERHQHTDTHMHMQRKWFCTGRKRRNWKLIFLTPGTALIFSWAVSYATSSTERHGGRECLWVGDVTAGWRGMILDHLGCKEWAQAWQLSPSVKRGAALCGQIVGTMEFCWGVRSPVQRKVGKSSVLLHHGLLPGPCDSFSVLCRSDNEAQRFLTDSNWSPSST